MILLMVAASLVLSTYGQHVKGPTRVRVSAVIKTNGTVGDVKF
jgi:hypothetical protein